MMASGCGNGETGAGEKGGIGYGVVGSSGSRSGRCVGNHRGILLSSKQGEFASQAVYLYKSSD